MQIIAAVSRDGAAAPALEELELEAPRAGEVLVRIATAGICHTDLRAHAGGVLPTPRPVVLGHEGAGTIMQVGPGVAGLRPGDRVVLSGFQLWSVCPVSGPAAKLLRRGHAAQLWRCARRWFDRVEPWRRKDPQSLLRAVELCHPRCG